jgi:hypothetical protein
VYRCLALSKLLPDHLVIGATKNMAWLYLYLHQLVYQNVAIANPDQTGMTGKSKQQIQTLVNSDINALSNGKFGQGRLSKNDAKNNKVLLLKLYADNPQKSIMFLLKFCAFLVKKVSEMNVGSEHERFTFAIMVIAHIFEEVAVRNDGFGEFAAIGSFHEKSQVYFLDLLWKSIESCFIDFQNAITGRYSGLSSTNIRPYMTSRALPNVMSFFHLSFQSLQDDFVFPHLHCINDNSPILLQIW